MQPSKPKNEIVFWVLMDRNDSNIYTTLSELKDNYRYLTFFPEVVMKGIFSELYAAEGSNFTNKILLDPNTGEHVLHNENYTYDIIDEKVRTVYTLLKEWQQSHSTMYDMLVDPLNAPKNISLQNLERLMLIYQQVHKYDLDVSIEPKGAREQN